MFPFAHINFQNERKNRGEGGGGIGRIPAFRFAFVNSNVGIEETNLLGKYLFNIVPKAILICQKDLTTGSLFFLLPTFNFCSSFFLPRFCSLSKPTNRKIRSQFSNRQPISIDFLKSSLNPKKVCQKTN